MKSVRDRREISRWATSMGRELVVEEGGYKKREASYRGHDSKKKSQQERGKKLERRGGGEGEADHQERTDRSYGGGKTGTEKGSRNSGKERRKKQRRRAPKTWCKPGLLLSKYTGKTAVIQSFTRKPLKVRGQK